MVAGRPATGYSSGIDAAALRLQALLTQTGRRLMSRWAKEDDLG
jgi:hypothetical protein